MHNVNSSGTWNVFKGWPRVAWALLLAACLLRVWGVWYGLPFLYISDEYHEVMRALQLGTGSFNFERVGKGGFYFILFFEYGIYFVLLKLAGVVASAEDFGRIFARDPSAFYWMGRATAALIGASTVAVVFQLARRAYSTTAGVLAAGVPYFQRAACRPVAPDRRRRADDPAGDGGAVLRAADPRHGKAQGLPACGPLCRIGHDDQADRDPGAAALVARAHVPRDRRPWRPAGLVEFAQSLDGRRLLPGRLARDQPGHRRRARFLLAVHGLLGCGGSGAGRRVGGNGRRGAAQPVFLLSGRDAPVDGLAAVRGVAGLGRLRGLEAHLHGPDSPRLCAGELRRHRQHDLGQPVLSPLCTADRRRADDPHWPGDR